jgi:hypothetical protein
MVWYQFDKQLPVDDSGNKRHLLDSQGAKMIPVPYGPGVLGRGASASFDGRVYHRLPGNEALDTEFFTIALWLYLLEDSHGSWRTIFSKGSDADLVAPALLLHPHDRRLHARAAVAGGPGGSVESSGFLPLRRWTHIVVTCSGGVLRLFVNGLKDAEAVLVDVGGKVGASAPGSDLYLGRDPWRAGINGYLDDFRWYDSALSAGEIKALTYPSLAGIGTDSITLGCAECRYPDAVRSCEASGVADQEGAHLCNTQELLSGGLQTARAMGWLSASPEVWYAGENDFEAKKLGLCCVD